MQYVELNNGVKIPVIANGPGIIGYSSRPGKQISRYNIPVRFKRKFITPRVNFNTWVSAVAESFRQGFRLIDNSDTYNNWEALDVAIKKSGVNKDEIILTTRVDNHVQLEGVEKIRASFENTLRRIGRDYIDILQFHWPVTDHFLETWMVMEQLYKEGKCRAIGVANCHQHHLNAILENGSVVPALNQVEVHPLFTQKPLIEFCNARGIQVQSYSPIARYDDRLFRLPVLHRIAKAHGKTPVQIILRWHIQSGLVPIVRSMNKNRIKENIQIFDFELSKEEMSLIDGININSRMRYDPDNCDFSIL